jgi:hypothetical protein
MAILVLSKPIIQTRNGVSTAVCSIDVLNGIIKTRKKREKYFHLHLNKNSILPNSLASPIINGT